MRGALVGFGLVLLLSLAWAVFVLLRSWVDGNFDRTFPGCDPCGFAGYAFRMVLVTGLLLGTFGVPAAIAGWLIEKVARRRGGGLLSKN
jgi:hypothetical protein